MALLIPGVGLVDASGTLLIPGAGIVEQAAAAANETLVGTGSALTLAGGTATTSLALAGTGSALALAGGTASTAIALVGTGSALALAGGTATTSISLAGTGSALALVGGTATLVPAINYVLDGTGSALTLVGGTATFTVSVPSTKLGGDDALRHPGWNKRRATLKRKREQEFTEQIRNIYRDLLGDPRTAEQAEQIVATVTEPVTEPVKATGESEAAREAMLMLRAEAMRKRADAMDEQALQAEIALRFLHQELRDWQEQDDFDAIEYLLPMVL